VKPLARSVVEVLGETRAVALGEMGHALTLGEVLTDQAVGVLGGASFPGVMRSGKEEPSVCGSLDVLVVMELGAVVHTELMASHRR